MEATLFEDLDKASPTNDKKPFFAVDHTNDEELLRWLKTEFDYLLKEYQPWHDEIKNNYKRYKEIQYREQMYQTRDLPEQKRRYTPQYVAPVIRDITDERIARMMEVKPSVAVIPYDDEAQDKVDAKIAKRFLKHLEKEERLDNKFMTLLRTSYVAGEGYLVPLWNPDKGQPHPDGKRSKKWIPIGEVDNTIFSPLRLLMEKTTADRDSDYFFKIDYEYEEVLKRQYPSSANDITADGRAMYYNTVKMEDETLPGHCVKITFFHKNTVFLPQGFECTFLLNKVLAKGPSKYEHGKLPLIILPDNQNMEEKHGRSFINSVKGMVSFFNNLLNMSVKMLTLQAWAKWFVEANSVDDGQLNNDTSIVKIKAGSKAPVLGQGNPVSPSINEWLKQSLEWVYSWGKSNSVIQGQPPAGVTAFVALQFVSESENRRQNSNVMKFNEAVRLTYEMNLAICGQFYKKEDQRTMLLIGKDNSWTRAQYDPSTLGKRYSLEIQNRSALPDSKAARTQYILDMGERYPDLFTREQILEMSDLAQDAKFNDDGAAAARCAETENEMMNDGKSVPPPIPTENLITHWRIHVNAMQDYAFKTKASPEVRKLHEEHLLGTEQLMMDQALKSDAFKQALMMIPQFPMLLVVPLAAPAPPIDPATGQPAPMEAAVQAV